MVRLRREGRAYVCECDYEERLIPKRAGFRWHGIIARAWATYDPQVALKLARFADEPLRAELEKIEKDRQERLSLSRAVDADLEVPVPEELDYLPYQRAGVRFALGRDSVLIGDEMGLGKTIQAIGVINASPDVRRVLVICPASLRLNWKNELERWLVRDLRVGIANGPSWPEGVDVVIINYDILARHGETIRREEWDLLIVDECHYLKNPKTIRTRQVLGAWSRDPEKRVSPIPARRRLFLTGTPIVNRPIELWPLLKSLDPETWRSWRYYVTRYCAGHQTRWGWDVSGASNLEELQERLRSTVMIRRLKKDVLKELPAKRRQVIEIPANGAAAVVERERKAVRERAERIRALRAAAELAKASDDPAEYRGAVERLREAQQELFEDLARVRHETAVAKIPYILEHLREAIEAGGKVVCFAHHHDVMNAIAEEFGDAAVLLTGKTPMAERQAAVERFQADESCRLFVGSIQAAGVGITLTASSHVVFAELDWVPGNVSQAEDRCHRIGQAESVLVQHLVLEGSIDARIARVIVAKQEVIDRALDSGAPPVESGDWLDSLLDEVAERAATARARREDLDREAEEFGRERIAAVHAALREIAGGCDGANRLDNQGFSKIDVEVGHSLANSEQLSARQAALGLRLVRKYRRQVREELLAACGLIEKKEAV